MKKIVNPTITIMSAITILLIIAVFSTRAIAADQTVNLNDEKIVEYVNKASAVIYAPSMSRGSLFRMRGAFGRAKFTRKTEDNLWCDVSPMRLLIGDFAGTSTGVSSAGSIILLVINPSIADKLANGMDIISDNVSLLDVEKVSTNGLQGVDILVSGSVSANSGFVLNPGDSILNDLFGASSVGNSCTHASAEIALKELKAGVQ
jgi:hypothetical protein